MVLICANCGEMKVHVLCHKLKSKVLSHHKLRASNRFEMRPQHIASVHMLTSDAMRRIQEASTVAMVHIEGEPLLAVQDDCE